MKKRVLSLFLAITLCLTLTPTGALAEESLPEQMVTATQETETPTENAPAAASVTKADGKDGGTYTTLPAALNAAQDGDTVKLLANHETNWYDVEGGEYATLAVVKKTLTLDLNGMTVDYLTVGEVVSDEEGGILESTDGNLTVVDNIQGGSHGKIKGLKFVKGSLAIQGGQIGDSDGSHLTCNENSGSVTISGGTVLGLTVGEGAAVTVNGGSAHAGNWFNDGTLSITGGTFKDVQFVNSGTIAISGGTFEKISNNDTNTPQPLMLLLAKDCAFVNENNTSDVQDGTKTSLTEVMVKEHTHTFENGKCDCGVASIVVDNNNSCYNTLQAALDAAANNASITSVTLGQDLTENVTFNRSAAGALTLNMNGHKLEAEAGVPLTVIGGELIIEGAGQINQNTASNANAFPAISLTGGKLVITGDLTAQGGYNSSNGRKPAIYATDGELDLQGNVSLNGGLTITGTAKLTNPLTQGTFYVDDSETGYAIAITANDNYNKALELLAKDYAFYGADDSLADVGGARLSTGTYTIKPHTCSYTQNETYGIAYCKCGRSHAHRDLSEEPSVLVNGICPICGYHCPHKNIGNDGVCTDCHAKMVAKVTVGETTTYTADLADALNKAANGTTITLLADTEISAYVNIYDETATNADQMVVTLDLAGHTVTSGNPIVIGADRNGAGSYYGTLKIVGTGNITLDSVNLDTREKGVLDLTGWTGESISSVTVTRIGNRNEGKLIVGKDAGHIGRLTFAFVNCPSAEIPKTKLYGGSYGEIITTSGNTPSLAGLLPNGYAFKNADGSFANATASNLFNVTVSACDHGGKNGFDGTNCPCGVAAVAETGLSNGLWRRFADLQTAIDADRDGGAEFKLLTDVTGDYTIDGTQNTGLDLNGHSIKGTVTVKGTKGDFITTTLSNTTNTTTVSIDKVVAYGGAKLAGSKYPAVIGTLTLAEGATWKNILNDTALGYKVLNTDGAYKWYAPNDVNGSQLNNVIINRLPITSKTLNLKVDGTNVKGKKVERGTTVQLCAGCNTSGATVTFSILKNGETTPITLSGSDVKYTTVGTGTTKFYVAEYTFNDVGSYKISFTATKDGYTVTSTPQKLTVTKPNLSNAEIEFPDGNVAAFNYATMTGVPTFVVKYKGQTLEKGVDYTITDGDSFSGVGPCTLTIRATANGDYTGSTSAEWTVRPLKVAASVGDIIKTYDGTTNLPANTKITFKSADTYYTGTPLPLAKGTDYEVLNACYDSADASQEEKTVSFTIKLKNEGYVFEDGTTQKDFTLNGAELNDKTFQINKATAPMNNPIGTLNIINGTCQTYTYDFNNILPGLPGGKYGTISYGQADISLVSPSEYNYDASTAVSDGGVLTLAQFSAKDGKTTGQIGIVKVNVTTTNYADFQLKLVLYAVDQIKPEPDGTITASEITYGQTLSESRISGKMKDPDTGNSVNGTFAWTDGTINPNAGGNEAEWTFTPAAGYEKYATVTGTVTVKVKPAKLTVSVNASRMYYYTGEEQIASIIASGQSVDSTPVTFTYSTTENGIYTSEVPAFTDAGTYTVYYKAEAANHEPATGTFTVTIKPMELLRFVSTRSVTKTYDGTAVAPLSEDAVTFNSRNASNLSLPKGAYSITNARFTMKQTDGSYADSPEVGNGKSLSFTVTLTSDNYVFESTTEDSKTIVCDIAADDANRFTITKAVAPTVQPVEMTIYNGVQKDYFVDLPPLPELGEGKTYGTEDYNNPHKISLSEGYTAQSALVADPENLNTLRLMLRMNQTASLTGEIGTVTIPVTTSNYKDINLIVNVKAENQTHPKVGTVSANAITYGQPLSASTITGTMQDPNTGATVTGTFTWDTTPAVNPNAGSHDAKWTFTPDESYGGKYTTYTDTATVTVNPKAVTVSGITAKDKVYDGNTDAVLDYSKVTLNGVLENDTLTVTATGTFESANAGEQKVKISGLELSGASAFNYVPSTENNQTETTATITARRATVTPDDNQFKVYEEKDPELTYKVSGVLDGETLKGITLTRAEGENAGEYAITATADAGANPNYDVTLAKGKFTINPKPIDSATVKLGKGLTANGAEQTQTVEKVLLDGKEIPADSYTVTGNTATAPGKYKLTITAKGNYTGTVEQTYVIISAKAEDAPGEEIAIGSGKVKVDVKSEGTVPPATLLTDKAELLAMLVNSGDITADELVQIANGASVDIVLTVKEANVSDEVKTAMAQAAKGYTIGQYLDISLFKYMTVNGSQQAGVPLHTTKDALTISVVVPDALINTNSAVNRTYCIVRNHEGTITVLDAAFDAAGKTLTFKTDRFSIYAIAYKDTAVPSSGSNPGSNNSSNDSETKKNEVAAPTPAPTPASTSKPSTITAMPQTGDTSNPTLYVVLLVASLLGLAVVFVCKKRNDK